ncbi:hypothetical protein J5J10_03930 [Ciceribacter sp. L1K23]|uniref:hypothetical protein n=1 Tax=Ciceribacter sp. L1K23 TaxID=2820276 RepID=UPI001B83B0BC|nr:hypothetical protein [Ciceribacter sp. L1K23]MBR0554820.1 hypothetical protein [Ciceribacter sp. L1K23]
MAERSGPRAAIYLLLLLPYLLLWWVRDALTEKATLVFCDAGAMTGLRDATATCGLEPTTTAIAVSAAIVFLAIATLLLRYAGNRHHAGERERLLQERSELTARVTQLETRMVHNATADEEMIP